MSFTENYDKVFLTAGGLLGVVGIGLAALFYTGMDEKYTIDDGINSRAVELPGIAKAKQLETAMAEDHTIPRPQVGQQHFDMFVAPYLWLRKDQTEPIDIYKEGSIHAPVPNSWFVENGLTDILKYSDALTRDPDGDGFTILEEYEAKTNPNDAASHPLLIGKLVLDRISKRGYLIAFASEYESMYTFRATSANGASLWRKELAINDKMGEDLQGSPDKDRFQLVEVTQKSFENAGTGTTDQDSVAVIKDLKPTKQGNPPIEIRKGNKYPYTVIDNTANFTIVAGNQAGTQFHVEEGLTFKIPGDDKTEYKIQSIDSKSDTVTVTATVDDRERTWKIQK